MKTKLTLYDKLLLIEYSNFKNRERISYEYIKSKSKNIIISKNAYATDLKGINLFAFMYLNINSFGTDSIITNFIIENFTKQNFANFNIETVGNNEIKSYIINLITYANNINNSVISSADIVNFIKLKMLIINKQIAIL